MAISKIKYPIDQVFKSGRLRSNFLHRGLDLRAKRMKFDTQIVEPLAVWDSLIHMPVTMEVLAATIAEARLVSITAPFL